MCSRCGEIKPISEYTKSKSRKDGLCSICKICDRERGRQYYLGHLERERKKRKAYSESHKEINNQRGKAWYINNREKRIEQIKAYKESRLDWYRDYIKRWYVEHPDKRKQYIARYMRSHPEIIKARNAKRKLLMRMQRVGKVDYDAILERDGLMCHICGQVIDRSQLQFDHIIPLSKGGAHSMENISVAHARCNNQKGDKILPPAVDLFNAINLEWIEPNQR